jgi:hypothetical protein
MIEAVTITSEQSGNEYQLYIYQGVARGCTCKSRKYSPGKPCKHMQAFTNPAPVAAYEGCEYCGCNHQSWNCPF